VGPDGTAKHTVRIRQVSAWLIFLAMTCWGTMAIVFSNFSADLRLVAVGSFGLLALSSVMLPRRNIWKIACFLSVFALVLTWWLTLSPSNDRDWQPDVATLPSATIRGRTVTVHNIRNCDYRSGSDYVVNHFWSSSDAVASTSAVRQKDGARHFPESFDTDCRAFKSRNERLD